MKNSTEKSFFLFCLRENPFILLIIFLGSFVQCTTQKVSRELTQVEDAKQLNPNRKYLKIHMKSGELYVLYDWKIEEAKEIVQGKGSHLDANRRPMRLYLAENQSAMPISSVSREYSIPFDQIVIVETNDKSKNPGVAALVITSVLTVPAAIACIANPKSCFGSCPTFYVEDVGTEKLVAEGFSSSISKSMEAIDVDRLDFFETIRPVELTMKNEALETHLIKSLSLLVCDKEPGNRVFQASDGKFYEVEHNAIPLNASYSSNSILGEISHRDSTEWFSLADSFNLATKEEIFFEFKSFTGSNGLILDKRQSLMTTFLFYQMLAYTGLSTSYLISEMETRKPKYLSKINKMYDLLGGIEVSVMDADGKWLVVDQITESGPIASDMHLIALPDVNSEKLIVKLRLTKGLWRINMVNLTQIKGESIPTRTNPERVWAGDSEDSLTLDKLINKEKYLVTYPGDEYRIVFPIESTPSQQYFLESEGYYIEWMREEWLREENMATVKKALLFPNTYLKKTAPFYKLHETEMESIFWSSKYAKIKTN